MSRFRPNPVAPEIRKVLKDKRRAHNIKLLKRLQKARAQAGLPPAPEPAAQREESESVPQTTARKVEADSSRPDKRKRATDILARSKEAGELARRQREEEAAKRRAQAEEAERQRAAAARRRIKETQAMMKRTPSGQLRLSSQMSVLLKRIQRAG